MSYIRRIKKGNRVYLAEVKCVRENGKPVQKFIRYVGKEVDGKKILSSSISNVEVESVRLYGPLLILDELAKSIHLHDHLGEYSNEILSMVYAHCVEPRSINQMNRWFEKTDLNHILNLEKLTEERLLKGLSSLENDDPEGIQRDIYEDIKKAYKLNDSGIFYDVTNTYFYGRKCVLGKLGHSKDGRKDKPLVQIGLAVTRDEGIPVFHRVFDGNIADAKTLPDVLSVLDRFGIRDVVMVYDRGISSKDNLLALKRRNIDSICGLAIRGDLKTMVRDMVSKKEFIDLDNRVKLSKSVFYAIGRRYRVGKVSGRLVVCYNRKMRHDIHESRYDEIMNARELLKYRKAIKGGLYKYFDRKGTIKKSVVKAAEELDGYSCLFATERLLNDEVIRVYFEKDLVEKAFQSIKGIVGLRPIRHWLYDRVIGHIFVCYLAYLLLSLLKYKLNKRKIKISPVEALRDVETLYKVYMRDPKKGFRLDRVVKMSKKQEKILKAVNKKLCSV